MSVDMQDIPERDDSRRHTPALRVLASAVESAQQTPMQAALALITPPRAARDIRFDLPPEGRRFSVWTELGRQSAYYVGRGGPLVALVHGWGGQSADFNTFVPILLNSGFSVAAVDLPAHGDSEGYVATISGAASALVALQGEVGKVDALIAHSMGCGCSVEAMLRGLAVDRVVLIAPTRSFRDYVLRTSVRKRWSSDYLNAVLEALYRVGVDTQAYDLLKQVVTFRQPALVLHADNDLLCPMYFGEQVARAWPNSVFLSMAGLGHRGILRDPAVAQRAMDFIAGQSSKKSQVNP